MEFLYMDHNGTKHAFEAGGTNLLDKYARLAEIKGLKLAVTDVVWDEIFVRWKERSPPPPVKLTPALETLDKWISANTTKLTTQERRLLEDYRFGRLGDYDVNNRGERSIIEHMSSNPDPHKSAIFSDDIKFHGEVAKWASNDKMPHIRALPCDVGKVIYTNPDMLVSACKEQVIHVDQYERLVGEFRKVSGPFNRELPKSYNRKFDARFLDRAGVERLREGKPVKGARILGAFGRLMAATGIAFVAIDTMTTAAHAATQLRDGDNEGATETVVEFGGRMAGAAIGAEEGVLLGAALGSIVPGLGTTIGAIAGGAIGGIVGATIGEQAAKDVMDAVQGKSHPPMDARLTDSTMHEYREPEVQALQNDLYEAGYSSEEVNYVCASVNAARDVARPTEGESELHATLSVLAERVTSGVRSIPSDDNVAELRDLPATEVVGRDADPERLPDGDGAAASPGEVAGQSEVESKGGDTVDAGKAAPVGHQAEAREIPHVVSAPGNEATPSDGRADGNSVETIPPAQMPETDRGEAPPNVPGDDRAVPDPKPEDRTDAREPVGLQAGQSSPDATASATPPQEIPAAPREVPDAEPAQRSDAEPGEQPRPIPSDPVPSDPVPSEPVPGRAPEAPAGSDLATAPAPPSSPPPDQPGAAAAFDGDAAPPTSPAPAAGEMPADDQRPGPSGEATGQNGRASHEIPDQNPSVERGARQRSEDRIASPDSPPTVTASDVPAAPVATEIPSPPSGDGSLHDEILADLDQLVDHEALAAAADETAMEEMSGGLVASDDPVTNGAGLAELEPVLAHESLNNEGVESLVVTGVLLTQLGDSDHSSEPSVVPDDGEFLQEIAELVEDEAVEAKADEAAVEEIDEMPDQLPSLPEELTEGNLHGETPEDFDDEDRDTEGDGDYSSDDATEYGDEEDDRANDTAGDDDRGSHSSDVDDDE
jgi:hypothetical protein